MGESSSTAKVLPPKQKFCTLPLQEYPLLKTNFAPLHFKDTPSSTTKVHPPKHKFCPPPLQKYSLLNTNFAPPT